MSKKKNNGGAPAPANAPEPEKVDTSQIQSDLGAIHAGRQQAEAKKTAPVREVQEQLRTALNTKRETVSKFVARWMPYLPFARQALAVCDLPESRIMHDAIQTARRGVLSAAKQLIDWVEGANREVEDIAGGIHFLGDTQRLPDWNGGRYRPEALAGRINALDRLEHHAEELKLALENNLARLKSLPAKLGFVVEETITPERPDELVGLPEERLPEASGLERVAPHQKKARTDFNPFDY